MDHILTKTVNGLDYTFMPLPFNPGHRVYRKLHGHMAPVAGLLGDLIGPALESGEKDLSSFLMKEGNLRILARLTEHVGALIADDEFTSLIQETFQGTTAGGQPIKPDHFSPPGSTGGGRLGDYDQVVLWSVWVHFGRPFFAGLGRLGTLEAQIGAQLQTPTT